MQLAIIYPYLPYVRIVSVFQTILAFSCVLSEFDLRSLVEIFCIQITALLAKKIHTICIILISRLIMSDASPVC